MLGAPLIGALTTVEIVVIAVIIVVVCAIVIALIAIDTRRSELGASIYLSDPGGTGTRERLASHTLNIAIDGMLVAGPLDVAVGETVKFDVEIEAGSAPVRGEARVARVDSNGAVALVIERIPAPDRARLARALGREASYTRVDEIGGGVSYPGERVAASGVYPSVPQVAAGGGNGGNGVHVEQAASGVHPGPDPYASGGALEGAAARRHGAPGDSGVRERPGDPTMITPVPPVAPGPAPAGSGMWVAPPMAPPVAPDPYSGAWTTPTAPSGAWSVPAPPSGMQPSPGSGVRNLRRRAWRRVKAVRHATLRTTTGTTMRVRTVDLSAGGALVERAPDLDVGQLVWLTLDLGNGALVGTWATIVREAPWGRRAIRFDGIADHDRRSLETLVSVVEPQA